MPLPRKGGMMVEIQVKAGREVRLLKVKRGENLMEALRRHGVTLPHPCHGKGKCGKCHVRVSAWGEQVDRTPLQGKESTRLACMTVVKEPISVQVGPKGSLQKLVPPFHRACAIIPGADACEGSAWARLIGGFSGKDRKSLEWDRERVLPLLRDILPASGGPVTLTRAGKRFFALESGDATQHRLGAAFMVSDESLSAVMVQLDDGMSLESASMKLSLNLSAGSGIPEGKVLISAMNGLVEALCTKSGKKAADISDAVITGNSSVLHAMTKLAMKNADLAAWVGDRHPLFIPSQQRVRADNLGLALGRHAGVWFPPAASAEQVPDWALSGALSCLLDRGSRKEAVKHAKKTTRT